MCCGRYVLAVAGTHGKTTTTSMLTWVLECRSANPGFLVGGVPLDFGSRLVRPSAPAVILALAADEPVFVGLSRDEYDTAFGQARASFSTGFVPRTAVLNLEYPITPTSLTICAIERQFHHLIRTVPSTRSW